MTARKKTTREATRKKVASKKTTARKGAGKKQTTARKGAARKTARKRAARKPASRAATRAGDWFAHVQAIAARLPGIEAGTSYGTPALRVQRKFLCRMKEDEETLVLQAADLEEKELILASDPAVFYETPHYHGWSAFLIHVSKIDDARLFSLIEASWLRHAGKRLRAEHDASRD